MITAPVAIFAYNRPGHLAKVLDALAVNELAADTALTIYIDGQKRGESSEQIDRVVEVASSASGFESIDIVRRSHNLGLAGNITQGVTEQLKHHESIIVLEDDIVTSPCFLEYMNAGLKVYRDNEAVISIHGYSLPDLGIAAPYFLKGADCWGWATWRRGWSLFEPDGQKLLGELREEGLTQRFDYGGYAPYTRMLQRHIEGKNQSWAVRWYASALLAGKLTLYPGASLVHNIGNEGSGSHSIRSEWFDTGELPQRAPELAGLEVRESGLAYEATCRWHQQHRLSLWQRMARKLKWLVKGD